MGRTFFLMLGFVFTIGCGYAQDTLKAQKPKVENELIEGFLPERMYNKVMETHQISLHTIKHILIDTETLAYSNKLVFVRELTQDEIVAFKQLLLTDSSYHWKAYNEEFIFYPSKQFVLKSSNDPLNIVANFDNSYISFIGLDGQMVLPIQNGLQEFLNRFN